MGLSPLCGILERQVSDGMDNNEAVILYFGRKVKVACDRNWRESLGYQQSSDGATV